MLWRGFVKALLLPLLIFPALAQQSGGQQPMEGARELYYLAVQKKDALPPVRKASAPAKKNTQAPAPAPQTGAIHLGLRYNVVLVEAQSGKSEIIDPDRTLRTGDCFAIDLESNRSGYVYVLAKQSSGRWVPLLPSPEMAEETNIIDPGKKIRIPSSYCFEIHDPPGAETLFVVLSRDPRDFYDLYEGIRRENAPAQPSARPTAGVELASNSVNSAVEKLSEQFGTRDIAIRKVSTGASAAEPPNSVYVVNNSKDPASSIVTQIQVRHR